jgi:hypothetical protein
MYHILQLVAGNLSHERVTIQTVETRLPGYAVIEARSKRGGD